VPWLGRWISTDPSGFGDGPNLYAYARGDPLGAVDRDGRQSDEELDAGASSTPPDQGDAGTTQQNPDQTLTVPADEPGTLLPGGAAPQPQAEQGQVIKEYVPRQGEIAREEVKEKIASAGRKADEFRQGTGAGVVNTPVGIVQSAAETTIKTAETAVAHPYLTAIALTTPFGLQLMLAASMFREGDSNAYRAVHNAFESVKVEYPHTTAGEVGNFFGGELAMLPLAFIGGGGAGAGRALAKAPELTEEVSLAALRAEALGGKRLFIVGPEGASSTRAIRFSGNRITYDTAAPLKTGQVRQDMKVIANNLVSSDQQVWWTGTHGTPTGEFGGVQQLDPKMFRRERGFGRYYGWDVKYVANSTRAAILSGHKALVTVYDWCFSSSCFLR
jgi:hypothetical protein